MRDIKMKYIIQERFTGYNDIYIEAESKDEAIAKYNRGHYKYSDVNQDDMFYNYEFDEIREEKEIMEKNNA